MVRIGNRIGNLACAAVREGLEGRNNVLRRRRGRLSIKGDVSEGSAPDQARSQSEVMVSEPPLPLAPRGIEGGRLMSHSDTGPLEEEGEAGGLEQRPVERARSNQLSTRTP